MSITIKTFAFVAAVSMLLLSCNEFGTNSDSSSTNDSAFAPSCKVYISRDVYDGPDDPSIVIIVGDVQDWIEEQLASGGNERKPIWIAMSDIHLANMDIPKRPEVSGTYNEITGESKFFINDQEVTYDYVKESEEAWRQEYIKFMEEQIPLYMASVYIPGENVEILHGGWKAFMTAEEIVELSENNEGLSISFWTEAPYMPGIPVDDMPIDEGGSGDATLEYTQTYIEYTVGKVEYSHRCP
ncbi:MAG: hypothetical protein LBC87_01805 [Fibromonadaceae bacterium]|jgi:hypothetical protein|nr:hypothetical protein [Fibromonadaceae bacterium]